MKNRGFILGGVTALCIILVFFLPPLSQDELYHQFADTRFFLGIPNFLNVLSNAPFFVIGAAGIWLVGVKKKYTVSPQLPYVTFFVGTLLTGIGSAYYHLSPSNQTLIWDRLPLTIVFMSVFSVIISQHIYKRAGVMLLLPLSILGVVSVVYWYLGELKGAGDLRPYVLVQFYPMIAILLIAFLYPSPSFSRGAWLWVILLYALAKVFESLDDAIYSLGGVVSGHTLKHLFASAAVLQILAMARSKKRQNA